MTKQFKQIDKTIREYIKYTLNSDIKIDGFVPNTHIAEVFRDVLVYSELEELYPFEFNNVKDNPYDSIGTNNPDDYDRLKDGRYVKKQTYSIGVNDILVPTYFCLDRLKQDKEKEIYRTYQMLRKKYDKVRNSNKLAAIVLKSIVMPYIAFRKLKAYKIKIT